MFDTVFGVPTHALVVHAVVVFVPLAALAGLIIALWPAARERYGMLTVIVTTIALFAIPVATESGEHLEEKLPTESSLVETHTEMGEQLLPFVALLWLGVVAVVGLRWWARRNGQTGSGGAVRIVSVIAAVIVVLAAIGSSVQVVRIGHSGAKAVWNGVGSSSSGS